MANRGSRAAKKATTTAAPERESPRAEKAQKAPKARADGEVAKEAVREAIEAAVAGVAPVAAHSALPVGKQKLVRDSFTMPMNEYEALGALKKRLLQCSGTVKKGELLRAGVRALTLMPDEELVAAVARIPNLKTGRRKHARTSIDESSNKGL